MTSMRDLDDVERENELRDQGYPPEGEQTPDVRTRVADLIDAHEWSRLGGSIGQQIADKLAAEELIRAATGWDEEELGTQLVCTLAGMTLERAAGGRLLTAQDVSHIIDAVAPLIRDHVAAAVQAERERAIEAIKIRREHRVATGDHLGRRTTDA